MMNLSLLTSDFWSVVVGVLLLGSQLNGWCCHPLLPLRPALPPSLPPPDPLCARPRPPVCPSPASEPPSPLCLQVCPGLCPRGGRARLLSLEASGGDVRAAARTAQRAVRTGVRVAAVIRRRLRTKHRIPIAIRVRPTLVYIALSGEKECMCVSEGHERQGVKIYGTPEPDNLEHTFTFETRAHRRGVVRGELKRKA